MDDGLANLNAQPIPRWPDHGERLASRRPDATVHIFQGADEEGTGPPNMEWRGNEYPLGTGQPPYTYQARNSAPAMAIVPSTSTARRRSFTSELER